MLKIPAALWAPVRQNGNGEEYLDYTQMEGSLETAEWIATKWEREHPRTAQMFPRVRFACVTLTEVQAG